MKIALVSYTKAGPLTGPQVNQVHMVKMLRDLGHDVDILNPPGSRERDTPPLSGVLWDPLPEVPGMWKVGEWFTQVPWGDYRFILNFEWAFVPLFYEYRVRNWFRVATAPCWADGTAPALNPLVDMLDGVIAGCGEVYGFFLGRGCKVVELPYPVDDDMYGPAMKKQPTVVWAGHDEYHKNLPLLRNVLSLLPEVHFTVCQNHGKHLTEPNVANCIGEPHSFCQVELRTAMVALLTTRWETYSNFLIEGALSGAVPVFPTVFGLRHIPGRSVDVFGRTPDQVALALANTIKDVLRNPPDPRAVRESVMRFSITGAAPRWDVFLKSLRDGFNVTPGVSHGMDVFSDNPGETECGLLS